MYEIVDVADPKCQQCQCVYTISHMYYVIIMSLLCHYYVILYYHTGVPCEVTDVIYNGPGQSIVECITDPEPAQQTYYPGN